MGSSGSKRSSQAPMRVLTLGTQACGKSTFHKQMKLLFSGPFSSAEKENYGRILQQCLTVGLYVILQYCEDNGLKLGKRVSKAVEYFKEQNPHALTINDQTTQAAVELWDNSKFQEARVKMGHFEYSESLEYVMQHLERLVDSHWELTDQDVLIARQRTTGLSCTNFTAYKSKFSLVDVGGDGVERRKWVHAEREEYSAIIFFASLDDFDVAAEGFKGTKLEESLKVWEDVMMHQVAPIKPIVVFLNKKDRFAQKIKTVSAREHVPGYQGEDGDYKAITKHIADLFLKGVKKSPIPRGGVYIKTTCMTDSEAMQYIFKSFYDFMVKRSLEASQLVGSAPRAGPSSGRGSSPRQNTDEAEGAGGEVSLSSSPRKLKDKKSRSMVSLSVSTSSMSSSTDSY